MKKVLAGLAIAGGMLFVSAPAEASTVKRCSASGTGVSHVRGLWAYGAKCSTARELISQVDEMMGVNDYGSERLAMWLRGWNCSQNESRSGKSMVIWTSCSSGRSKSVEVKRVFGNVWMD